MSLSMREDNASYLVLNRDHEGDEDIVLRNIPAERTSRIRHVQVHMQIYELI